MSEHHDLSTPAGRAALVAEIKADTANARAPLVDWPRRDPAFVPLSAIEQQVKDRHAKVYGIIVAGLLDIEKKIEALDPETMGIDHTADWAEIVRQASHHLMMRLRDFSCGTRDREAERKADVAAVEAALAARSQH
jgi:hypothetical protein